MISKYRFLLLYLTLPLLLQAEDFLFITNESQLKKFQHSNTIMVASTGRSGSTLLTEAVVKAKKKSTILKTHILPPNNKYKGKIIFIFSNPDKAVESILHLTIDNDLLGKYHFSHVKTSDQNWLLKIGSTSKQTIEDNLLAYDALGYYQHLVEWLQKTTPSTQSKAQIMAIKYENLWDDETILALKKFLKVKFFSLPPKQERGYSLNQLNPKEITFKEIYNLGTYESPIYRAYDNARNIWNEAQAIQYLNLN